LKIYTALLLLLTASVTHAENIRYVTDQLEITLRSGQSIKHQIVRMLPSGSALELLETDEESKYSRVRTPDGTTEGWVLSRYLDEQPSARDRLATTTQQLQKLNDEMRQLQKTLKQVSSEKAQLNQSLGAVEAKNKQLTKELEHLKHISANTIGVDKDNQTLKAELQRLQANYDQSQTRITSLQDSSDREWMLVGAGVVLLGILIGLIIPKIRWRRKSEWGSL